MSFHGQRYYGFFKCGGCGIKWESSQVYEHSTGGYWRQQCKRCKTESEPYEVEPIKCRHCGNTECTCTKEEKKERHVDPNKSHRSDLCSKCKAGFSCAYRR